MPDDQPGNPTITPSGHAPGEVVLPLVRALESIRRRAWLLLLVAAICTILGFVIATVTGLGIADYYLRTPPTLRIAILVAGLIGIYSLLRARVIPALRFHPTLTEVALRVERTPQGKKAGLDGLLASGLELATPSPFAVDRDRSDKAVRRAAAAFTAAPRAFDILSPRRTLLAVAMAVVLALPAMGLSVWRPHYAAIALERIFTPWTSAAWPKRTQLADLTGITVHSSRASIPIRAIVQHEMKSTPDVWVRFRTVAGGVASSWRSELLTAQGRREHSPDAKTHGDLVERLIEADADASPALDAHEVVVEYRLQSIDDQTAITRVRLVDPPLIVRAEVEVVAPSYVPADAGQGAAGFVSGTEKLSEGVAVASVGPILAGSQVTVRSVLNKPVAAPAGGPGSLFVGPQPTSLQMTAEGPAWEITFVPESGVRVVMLPVDEFGIASPSEMVVGLSVVSDQPPTATILTPVQDEGVLATATITVEGEARDDVWLASAAIERQIAPRAAGSEGVTNPPSPPEEFAAAEATKSGVGAQARVVGELKLADMGVKPGDEITVCVLARDVYTRDGATHDPVRSAPRRLFVISEAQFVEQVQNELAAVRDAAMRLDQDQEQLAAQASRQTPAQRAGTQRSLTQRLVPPAELIDRLAERLARNALNDDAMRGMLTDAAESLRAAADESQRAAEALSQADNQVAAGQDPAEAERQAAAAQDQVRQELASLVGMLDRGQDGWTVRREIQQLAQAQRELANQTREATRQTAGKDAQSLTPMEREKLAGLAQQQQDLAARTEEALRQLEERAKALEQSDPGQAEAMRQAAQQGRERQVAANQRQAAQAIQENRSQSANELQQKAAEAMEQMLERFDQSQRQRDEALRRVLAELTDQIRGLVEQQRAQLDALSAAGANPAGAGLDRPMIHLHSSTLGLIDSVDRGPDAAKLVLPPLEAAAKAQGAAVELLRASSPSADQVRENEQVSLVSLERALSIAGTMSEKAEQQDQSRKRGEILEAYRAALEQQAAITFETSPLLGKTLDRRQRAGVRALGEREDGLRTTLAEIRAKNPDIEATIIFSYAHEQLDRVLTSAAEALRGGSVSRSVGRDQQMAEALLKSLVQAMSSTPQEQAFREGADEGGGGQGGGEGGEGGSEKPELIPDLAELQGLRGLQEIAALRTRLAGSTQEAITPQELADIQRLQRDIAERAKTLLEKLKKSQDGGDAAPDSPAPPAFSPQATSLKSPDPLSQERPR